MLLKSNTKKYLYLYFYFILNLYWLLLSTFIFRFNDLKLSLILCLSIIGLNILLSGIVIEFFRRENLISHPVFIPNIIFLTYPLNYLIHSEYYNDVYRYDSLLSALCYSMLSNVAFNLSFIAFIIFKNSFKISLKSDVVYYNKTNFEKVLTIAAGALNDGTVRKIIVYLAFVLFSFGLATGIGTTHTSTINPKLSLIVIFLQVLQPLSLIIILREILIEKRYHLISILLLLLFLFGSFLSGSRAGFLHFIFTVLFLYSILNRKISKSFIIVGFLLVLLSSVIASLSKFYRVHITFAGKYAVSIIDKIKIFSNVLLEYSDQISPFFIFYLLINRISMFEPLVRTFEYTGVYVPFQHGQTILLTLKALIPKAIYPERPDTNIGKWFGEMYNFSQGDIFISLGLPGEFYLNFGIYGGIISVFILGLINMLVYSKLRRHLGNLGILYIYYIYYNLFILGFHENYFAYAVNTFIKTSTIFILIIITITLFFKISLHSKGNYSDRILITR